MSATFLPHAVPPEVFPLGVAPLLFTSPSNSLRSATGKGPEESGVKDQLQRQFSTIIQQFEVKLEQTPGASQTTPYTARPGGTISVGQVTQSDGTPAQYKGYRHYVTGGNTFKVNRITIHGQIADGIDQTEIEKVTFSANGGVYVYFPLGKNGNPELNKPLLICLSPDGNANENNKWYKRNKSDTWTNAVVSGDTSYDSINPGASSIDSKLVTKLGEIKKALGDNDKGCPSTGPISLSIHILNTCKRSTGAGRGSK